MTNHWRIIAGATATAALLTMAACNQHGALSGQHGAALGHQYNTMGETPPNAREGACYKKVLQPAQFRDVEEQVLVQAAGKRQKVIPAQYETVTEQVLVSEATTKRVKVPATYKYETREIEVRPEVERVKVIPAKFRTISETVWVAPDGTHHDNPPRVKRYSKHKVVTDSGREVRKHANDVKPGDRVIHTDGNYRIVVEAPRYGYQTKSSYGVASGWRRKTITRREIVEPEETRTYVQPAVTKSVRAKVVDQPERYEEVVVPAEYKTVTRRRVVQEEQVVYVDAPAEYETVVRREQIAPQQVAWAEILCDASTNEDVMRDLQRALFKEGYYRGAVDGTYNIGLDTAVRHYQEDNQLAQGGVTLATLRALGVAY